MAETPAVDARLDPSTQSSDYKACIGAWTMISDILAGIDQVKAKAKVYLPQYPKESEGAYNLRLASAPWRPEWEDGLRSLAAKPFTKQVKLSADADEALIGKIADEKTKERQGGYIDDIDGEGNSLHVFAKNVFINGVGYGLDAIYVTYPDAAPARNRAQEKALGRRPYWVHVRAKDIIDLKVQKVDGKLKVVHIRMIENSFEQDGFAEVLRERIRVVELDPNSGTPTWRVYLKVPRPGTQQSDWIEEKNGAFEGIAEIPIALYFTNERQSHYRVKPPLYDQAHVQLELYRAGSRKDRILTLAGSPMLKFTGFKPPKPTTVTDKKGNILTEYPQPVVEVGPGVTIFCPAGGDGVQPDADYIQPNPSNIKEVREDVEAIAEDLQRGMLQPTTPKSGGIVATGLSIDAAKAHSAVEAWALLLKDALDQAMVYTCQWLNIADTVSVSVHTDFGVDIAGTEEAKILGDMQKRKVISAKTEREEVSRRGILGPDFDEEQEEERLAEEAEGLETDEEIEPDIDPITGRPLKQPIAQIPAGE